MEAIRGGAVVIIDEDDENEHGAWNPNYIGDGHHLEEYDGDSANVRGRYRLPPQSDRVLLREIRHAGDLGTPRIERVPRGAAMRARLGL